MKKLSLALCLWLACGPALADELADAQLLWEKKDFARAFERFSALASAGNAAAQLQLGEMYGFGEGTPEDAGKAAHWLRQAAAGGNKEAPQSLALVQERTARKAEIAYYASGFDGAAVAYAKYGCARPAIPAVSTKNADIEAINAAVKSWRDCYGRFASGLNSAMPVTNTIPPGVLRLMSNEEFVRAGALIATTYTRIADDAGKLADQIMAENEAWKGATEQFVEKSNRELKLKLAQDALMYEASQREAEASRRVWQSKSNAGKAPLK